DHTTAATGALVEVDAHAPAMALVLHRLLPEREQGRMVHGVLYEIRMLLELGERRLAHEHRQAIGGAEPLADAVDGLLVLRGRHAILFGARLDAGTAREVPEALGAQAIGVHTHAPLPLPLAVHGASGHGSPRHRARRGTTVAEVQLHG